MPITPIIKNKAPKQLTENSVEPFVVDARHLACPAPVMRTMQVIDRYASLTVLVDNFAASENVTRLALFKGFMVDKIHDGQTYRLQLKKAGPIDRIHATHPNHVPIDAPAKPLNYNPRDISTSQPFPSKLAPQQASTPHSIAEPSNTILQRATLVVTTNSMGNGPVELGELLMGSFFQSLLEIPPLPQTIALINSGVKLALPTSKAFEQLRLFASQGTHIIVCGTCIDYYQLANQIKLGHISNMYEIATVMMKATKLVQL